MRAHSKSRKINGVRVRGVSSYEYDQKKVRLNDSGNYDQWRSSIWFTFDDRNINTVPLKSVMVSYIPLFCAVSYGTRRAYSIEA